MYSPYEVGRLFIKYGVNKAHRPIEKIFILSIFGAFFVGLSSTFSLVCKNITESGYTQFYSGLAFPIGIILVHYAGGELITGNSLLLISFYSNKLGALKLLFIWLIILVGNFIGSILISMLVVYSHIPNMFSVSLAQIIIVNGIEKCTFNFGEAFIRGILANFFNCLGIWVAMSSKDMRSKIFGLIIPNFVIMTTGLDHCVADMFYILAGIFTCYEYDLDSTEMNWGRLFYKNIIPVLLGNIVGGGILMGMSFWYLNLHKDDSGYAKWGKNTLTDSKIKSSIDNAQKQNPDLSIARLNN